MGIKNISIWIVSLCILSLVISCAGDRSPKSAKKLKSNEPKVIKSAKIESAEEIKKESAQDEQGTPPAQIKKAKELIAAVSEEDMAAMKPKKLFKNYCGICHGFKGNMQINGAKDLTKSTLSLEESVAQVYHGKGLMTPFKGIMKDDEIVAVSKYLETLRK